MRSTLGTIQNGGDDDGGNSPGDPGNPVPTPDDDPPTPSE